MTRSTKLKKKKMIRRRRSKKLLLAGSRRALASSPSQPVGPTDGAGTALTGILQNLQPQNQIANVYCELVPGRGGFVRHLVRPVINRLLDNKENDGMFGCQDSQSNKGADHFSTNCDQLFCLDSSSVVTRRRLKGLDVIKLHFHPKHVYSGKAIKKKNK